MLISSTAVVVLLTLFLISVQVLTVVVIVVSSKHKKRLEKLSEYQINVTAKIDESIPNVLDMAIKECFTDYSITNLIPLNEGYINSERESQIRKELVELIARRLSSAALDKLSLYYNLDNIAEIIANKIYIIVMDYVIDHNNSLDNE